MQIEVDNTLPQGTMVATVGQFDGVHLGHRHILRAMRLAAAKTGLHTLVVTFEENPQHTLAPHGAALVPHIMPLHDRLQALESEGVDCTLVLRFDTALAALTAREFMTLLRDRYGVARLLVGYNNHMGCDRADGKTCTAIGQELGIAVEIITPAPEMAVSSSLIRRTIAEQGDVATASTLLGRQFSVTGVAVHGKHVGTQIGFPTANVGHRPEHQLMPAPGAYAVRASVNGDLYYGMAGVGHRPEGAAGIDANLIPLEVNLFDYTGGDLYDSKVKVIFVDRLRPEMHFDSLHELQQQLTRDRDAAMRHLNIAQDNSQETIKH